MKVGTRVRLNVDIEFDNPEDGDGVKAGTKGTVTKVEESDLIVEFDNGVNTDVGPEEVDLV